MVTAPRARNGKTPRRRVSYRRSTAASVSWAALSRLPDVETTIAVVRAIVSAPTAPYHEAHALAAILEEVVIRSGINVRTDTYGQLFARVQRGHARPIALVAHTDHPGFEVISAHGHEGI